VSSTHDARERVIVDDIRAAVPDVIAVYLFGSSAQGSAHSGSDTDIAVLVPQALPPEVRFDLQERLAARIGGDVDLVDLGSASPVMAVQVLGGGRLLHDGDTSARGLFEDRALSAYARLNEERRGILQRIRDEGTVYGR
jgi:predicted nucleotidyltransferase